MKIGFIGVGNMGGAILCGALQQGYLKADDVVIYDVDRQKCDELAKQYGMQVAQSNAELTKACECVLLAVKPVYLQGVIDDIKASADGKCIISIAAGWTVSQLTAAFGGADIRLLRVMPNTPALVGAGYTALCSDTTFDETSLAWAKGLFDTLGESSLMPERLFDAVVAVSGSSPAYVFMMIDAMADGAVKLGMPRADAIRAAAQSVLGSAKMVLDTGTHPAILKDNVCSPAGTTIEAVEALEQGGFRAAIINAMTVCAEKNRKMAQPKGDDRK